MYYYSFSVNLNSEKQKKNLLRFSGNTREKFVFFFGVIAKSIIFFCFSFHHIEN